MEVALVCAPEFLLLWAQESVDSQSSKGSLDGQDYPSPSVVERGMQTSIDTGDPPIHVTDGRYDSFQFFVLGRLERCLPAFHCQIGSPRVSASLPVWLQNPMGFAMYPNLDR